MARNTIGFVNRTYSNYYVEHRDFNLAIASMGDQINWETQNYSYRIVKPMNPVSNLQSELDLRFDMKIIIAQPKKSYLNRYLGIVYVRSIAWTSSSKDINPELLICESQKSLAQFQSYPKLAMPVITNDDIQCPPHYRRL